MEELSRPGEIPFFFFKLFPYLVSAAVGMTMIAVEMLGKAGAGQTMLSTSCTEEKKKTLLFHFSAAQQWPQDYPDRAHQIL